MNRRRLIQCAVASGILLATPRVLERIAAAGCERCGEMVAPVLERHIWQGHVWCDRCQFAATRSYHFLSGASRHDSEAIEFRTRPDDNDAWAGVTGDVTVIRLPGIVHRLSIDAITKDLAFEPFLVHLDMDGATIISASLRHGDGG